jgi:hypothetical protein
MDEIQRRVDAFLRSYGVAFEHLDGAQVAAHFAFPLHVVSDDGELKINTVPSLAEWLPQVERLTGAYRRIGVRSAHPEETSIQAVSPRLVQVRVRWRLLDGAGAEVYEFSAGYALAEVQGELRIVALAHDELPRLRARLARV